MEALDEGLDAEQRRRFEELKGKAEGETGLTDEEANELGYLYAQEGGRPYARRVAAPTEDAVQDDPRLDAEEVERLKEELEGDAGALEREAYGKRPAGSDMYGAAMQTREGDEDIVEQH
jgi:hypothetical protein